MEDGSPTRSLLLKPKLDNYGESSNRGHDGVLQTESSSTITFVVVLSTLVAACGSYAFGNAVWYSSPAESGIEDDLGLGSAEYSVFGSLLTTGAMLGAVLSGKIADFIGRRGAMGASEMFCILGWLAIFSKVPVYIAEITPKSVRGAFTSLTQDLQSGKDLIAMMVLIGVLSHQSLADHLNTQGKARK